MLRILCSPNHLWLSHMLTSECHLSFSFSYDQVLAAGHFMAKQIIL